MGVGKVPSRQKNLAGLHCCQALRSPGKDSVIRVSACLFCSVFKPCFKLLLPSELLASLSYLVITRAWSPQLTFFREFCRKLKLSVEICKHELEEACLDGLEAASKQSSRDPATNSSQRDPNWAPEAHHRGIPTGLLRRDRLLMPTWSLWSVVSWLAACMDRLNLGNSTAECFWPWKTRMVLFNYLVQPNSS
jgi:hypothetical protein